MNIFIIGSSGTGKSPVAAKLANLGYKHIKASQYFREAFGKDQNSMDRNQFIREITEFSKAILEKDPLINVRYIKGNLDKLNVIEGVRNPIDFFNLYEPNSDKVIYLNYLNNELIKTDFESGIDIILSKVNKDNLITYEFKDFWGQNSLEEQLQKDIKNGTFRNKSN